MKQLIIIGANGHGKVAADIAGLCGYKDILFLDDDPSITNCLGFQVAGGTGKIADHKKSAFFVAIGNPTLREHFMTAIEEQGSEIATLIHPQAVIAKKTAIGSGSIVMAGAVINPDTNVGKGCIINTGATIDHDCSIAEYVHISVGAHLAGTVTVGKATWLGIGAIVSNNLTICAGCTLGAGAVVIKDIEEQGTYVGVPARKIKA